MWNTPSTKDTGASVVSFSRKSNAIFILTYKITSWAEYGFWGGLLLIGIINRLVTHVSAARRLKDVVAAADDVETTGTPSVGTKRSHSGPVTVVKSIHHWLRANVIIPAAFGSHHNRPLLWSTIPTRMETIVVASFWILTLILCCVNYLIFWPNL